MKRVIIGFAVLSLIAISALGTDVNTYADGDGGAVEIEKIDGDDLPDDLLVKMSNNYSDDVSDNFMEFYLGSSEKFDEYQRDYEKMEAAYSRCYDEDITPEEQIDACIEESNTNVADMCMKYGLFCSGAIRQGYCFGVRRRTISI